MEYDVYLLARPVTLNNLKGAMRAAIKKFEHPLLQNIWHEVEYRLDASRATTGASTGLYRV
jgi:hypothetical protein